MLRFVVISTPSESCFRLTRCADCGAHNGFRFAITKFANMAALYVLPSANKILRFSR